MNIRLEPFTSLQSGFLTTIDSWGAVVETVAFSYEDAKDECVVSKEAAIMGMKFFKAQYEEAFRKRNPGLNIEHYYNIRIDESIEPKGTLISFEEFIGEGYDFEKKVVDLFTYNDDYKSKSRNTNDGFVKALLDPPYTVRIPGLEGKSWNEEYEAIERDKHTLLLKQYISIILDTDIDAPSPELVIYYWSDDWSNYFDDGKEWWGAYYWTVLNRKDKIITVIAASSTD